MTTMTVTTKNTDENICLLDILPTDVLSVVAKNLSSRDNGNLLLSKVQGVEKIFKDYKIRTDIWIKLDKATFLKKFDSGLEEYKDEYVEENYPDLDNMNVHFDLSGLDLSGLDLSWADLSGANLIEADLSEANLEGANLSGANLQEANCYKTCFFMANLSGADLSEANLYRALVLMANLDGAKFDGKLVTLEEFARQYLL